MKTNIRATRQAQALNRIKAHFVKLGVDISALSPQVNDNDLRLLFTLEAIADLVEHTNLTGGGLDKATVMDKAKAAGVTQTNLKKLEGVL